jgi:adenylate cyclase
MGLLPRELSLLIAELRRRRVVRVAVVYGVVGYGVVQVANNFFPALQLPAWTTTLIAALVVLGFPIALVLAWAFEITPAGVRRTKAQLPPSAPARDSGRALGYLGLGMLVGLVVVGFGYLNLGSDGKRGLAAEAEVIRSIAVLPFANMSTDAENQAFSDGLTEELLNALAQVSGLRVPARTSSFAFRNAETNITEIGRRLNVETVLEGSVRRSGDQLRIAAQLIDVASGTHLWSRSYDRELRDVFAIQEEIAQAIVGALLPRFADTRGHGDLVVATTEDIDAYQLYLQGRHRFWQGGTEQNLSAAADFFTRAVAADPDYALAYAGLSDALMLQGGSGYAPPHDIFPAAKRAAQRALALNDRLAEGYVALASINWLYDWDWPQAERNYRLSFSANPLLHTRCICYAWYLAVTGNPEAAASEAERARQMDPVATLPRVISGWMYYLAGRPADAQRQVDELLELNPHNASAHRIAAWLAWDRGARTDAIASLERVRHDADERGGFAQTASPVLVADLASMYAQAGRAGDARLLLAGLIERAHGHYVPAEYIAAVLGSLGELDTALEWLERAYESRSNLAQFNVLPMSAPLRMDPRYQDVLARIGLPQRS